MSKNKRKNKMNEARFSGTRFGFLGQGFGKENSYDPYKSIRESDEESRVDVESVEGAWAGGENLESPVDYVKTYHGLENVKEPESLGLVMTEAKLRKIIRETLAMVLK